VALCDDSDEVLDSIIPRNFTTHHLLTDWEITIVQDMAK
jgi:hypothetical protein